MVSIPTPVPKTLVRTTRRLFSGAALDTLWKLFVVAVLVLLASMLAMMGVIGGAVAGVIIGSLISETVRKAIKDVWNRNFWVFSA